MVQVMRIQSSHFFNNKPEGLSNNEWLTLALVNLVNEVQYLFVLKNEEEQTRLMAALERNPGDEKVFRKLIKREEEWEEMEIRFIRWEPSRYYLEQRKLSTFKYAVNVSTFVSGMIANFNI